jgi:hypothetical protein
MLDGLTPDLAPRLVLAVGGVGIALVLLVLVLIFLKRRNSPLFIKGGKAREPRLMVLDAAAVDPKRRLVLIRRDEIEHLIMIGGPTDIVIESGIVDRNRPAARAAAGDEIAVSRTVTSAQPVSGAAEMRPTAPPTTPAADPRPLPARAPDPSRTAASVPSDRVLSERPQVPVAESRAAAAAASVAGRSSGQSSSPSSAQVSSQSSAQQSGWPTETSASDRVAPSADRPAEAPRIEAHRVDRPAIEKMASERAESQRPSETRGVSAMGSMLYGEDREPMTGGPARPVPSVAADPRPNPMATRPAESTMAPATAQAALDAARTRVLPTTQPAGVPLATQPAAAAASPTVTAADAERALAARLEASRRAQPQEIDLPPLAPPVSVATGRSQAAAREVEPSDFEKLLEAELDANGIFGQSAAPGSVPGSTPNTGQGGGQSPAVRADSRITNAGPANNVAPPVRVSPPITGASPDLSSEDEVARLLGEIAVNRKT